jgi:hypothetical protein
MSVRGEGARALLGVVAELPPAEVARAGEGDKLAWDHLVEVAVERVLVEDVLLLVYAAPEAGVVAGGAGDPVPRLRAPDAPPAVDQAQPGECNPHLREAKN